MYLCLGVFMNLVSKEVFGKPNYATQGNIFETIHNRFGNFEYSPLDKGTISKYFSCTREINDIVINEITRLKTTDISLLFDNLKAIAIDLQNNIISAFKQKDLVSVIIYIIEHDDEISASTVIGKSGYYTRNELLHAKEIDLTEFLENILYFIFDERKNNDSRGNQTIKWIREKKNFTDIVSHSTINLITYNPGNKQATTLYLDNSSSNVMSNIFPHKLTDYTVVGASENTVLYRETENYKLPKELTNSMIIHSTSQKVLFREKEFNNIIYDLRSNQVSNIFLHGMGGCGKTSLASMIYFHLKDQYDCYGWINYSGNIKQSMISDISINYSDETMIENDASKKWETLKKAFKNSSQSKLLVIDNVDNIDSINQHPRQDKELIRMSSWNNITIIITSRLPELPGYETSYEIENLGNATDDKKCIELFYHYSPESEKYRSSNEETVRTLCALAGYNTMVIELLAKGCYHSSHDLNKYYQRIKNNFSYADDTLVETNHDYTILKTDKSDDEYYDIGNETVASQLYKLFNIKTRSPLQQLILWDFHCLRENERVFTQEVTDWMGFNLKDITPLVREGWIKQTDDYFFIHPLVNQAISCSEETNSTYWAIKQDMIREGKCLDGIISSINDNSFFNESDSFETSLRKLVFVDCLSYKGDILSANDWINIADFARKRGNINLGKYYYKKAHDYFSSVSPKDDIDMKQHWKCTYYYGYMLSYTKSGYKDAELTLKESLELAEQIIAEEGNTDSNILMLATSLDHLGYILSNSLNNDILRITLADIYLNEAVNYHEILCSAHPEHYRLLHDYAWSLDNLGAFYTNIDVSKVIFSKNTNPNDITYLTMDEILENKSQTEKLLKTALDIRISLANARGNIDSTEVAWTYFNLAELIYTNLTEKPTSNIIDINYYPGTALKQYKMQNAEAYINNAIEIYQRLDQRFPGQHMSSEARTTALYGKLLMLCPERHDEALEQFDKALTLYITLDNDNPGMYRQEIHTLHILYHL